MLRLNLILLCALTLLLTGCVLPREAKVPMDSITVPLHSEATIDSAKNRDPRQANFKRARTLIVFLPGAREVPQDLITEGFVKQVRDRNIDADIQVIDSHIGYFLKRTFDVRIRDDIINPARQRGYEQIWLAGISLGGFGSLMYPMIYPEGIDGIIAMAPYIADNHIWKEVTEGGGLAKWNAPQPLKSGDYQRTLMQWLAGYRDLNANKRPKLFIGFGSTDGQPEFDKLNAGAIPESNILRAPGGHDWPPWKQMWGDVLEKVPLPRTK
jgi:hypothetical protein